MRRRWLCGILAACMVFVMLPGLSLRTSAYQEMSVTQELVDFVKKLEGFAPRPFWDYSQYTVGYGSECPDDKVQEWLNNETGIPLDVAEELLREDMNLFEQEVNDYAKKWGLTFTQQQFDALVSMSFNCGGNWKWETNGILNHAVRQGATGTDLIYAFGLYSKAHKDYLLIRRRLCEMNMYINGEYKAFNKDANAIPDNFKWIFLDGNGGEVTYAIHAYDSMDKAPIKATFTSIPTGVDAGGKKFVYEFAGWYTASTGGTKVEKLDGSLKNATVLYAQWKDPSGKIVALPKGDPVQNLKITVKCGKDSNGKDRSIDVWAGPATFYEKIGSMKNNTSVVITEVYDHNGTAYGKFNGGWISLAYTDYETVKESLTPDAWPREGTVTGDNVNVRSGPGTGNPMQYQVNKGDRVTVTETYQGTDYLWGKLSDGNWICMTYVKLDPLEGETTPPYVTGISLLRVPDKTDYVQKFENRLEMQGSLLQVNYSDGTIGAMTLSTAMVTSFSNATLGKTTVKIAYEGFTASFTVNIVKATVTFKNYDGTVLSQAQYAYGETVKQPATPTRPADGAGKYTFIGWDREVTACKGNATYTAVYKLETPEVPTDYIPGDVDGNGNVNEDDAIYLLRSVFFPEDYPVSIPADYDGNGTVNEDDAIYLLRSVFFPEDYPLTNSGT